MRPNNQLVNPPKMKKLNSICVFSQFLLQLWPLKLGQLANQSGSSRHMTSKMTSKLEWTIPPGVPWWHRLAGGLGLLLHDAKCGINLNFLSDTQWTKTTFHVILQSILLFLLVQYDGIHFIFINHDNFKFIWIFERQHSWKSETCQISWEKLLWSDGLSHCQNDADYRDFSILSTCHTAKQNQFVHHNFVNPKIFWSEIIGLKLSTSIK